MVCKVYTGVSKVVSATRETSKYELEVSIGKVKEISVIVSISSISRSASEKCICVIPWFIKLVAGISRDISETLAWVNTRVETDTNKKLKSFTKPKNHAIPHKYVLWCFFACLYTNFPW